MLVRVSRKRKRENKKGREETVYAFRCLKPKEILIM